MRARCEFVEFPIRKNSALHFRQLLIRSEIVNLNRERPEGAGEHADPTP